MHFTDEAINQAHKLLLKVEEDPRLPELYQREPGLAGVVEEARHDLVDVVQRLATASITDSRALEKARRVEESLARIEVLLPQVG